MRRQVPLPDEDRLEMGFDLFEGDIHTGAGDQVVRKLPIVVPSALILAFLDLPARDGKPGEVLHRSRDGFAV